MGAGEMQHGNYIQVKLDVCYRGEDAVMLGLRGVLRVGGAPPRQTPSLFHSSSFNSSETSIVIPPRVERSPTDILEALASTVSRDYTAPDYKVLLLFSNTRQESQPAV